ncbi:hypothetical protein PVK06_017959 [Gossypium arboreum]|uniref:Uncharacterized protein n=1 Tax=Gossypium arboreum TaxID=29729 RepID=A0ABR0Q4C5_GOSAR|nr:hypothetical protein PVK06_017959 [Gossypium arboreum]
MRNHHTESVTHWEPSNEGWLKFNDDGSTLGIDEIKMSIREELFRIIGRDANGMADSLAKSGCFPSQMLFADW